MYVPKHLQMKDINVPQEVNDVELLSETVKSMVQELPVDSTIIVFCETKKSVDRVCDALAEKKIPNLPFYE